MIAKLCLTLAIATIATCTIVNAQQTGKVTSSGIGYLEYLPDGYHSNSNRYPVVISLHGIREKGTSSTDPAQVIRDLPKVAYVGLPKYVKNGKKYPFIMISPQLKSQYSAWPPHFIIEVLNYVKTKLRIDDRRVYLTGLSLGGMGVWQTAGAYPHVFAAITPICPGANALSKANALAAENVAAWGFHGGSDTQVSYTVTTNMINAMNSAPIKPNPLAKVTIFAGMNHGIWDKVYHETNALDWMLSFRNGTTSSTPTEETNSSPVVKAGTDQTITLPENSVSIQGSASDPDGQISSYRWTKASGGNATLSGTTSAKFSASNLAEGTYVFRLTVEDNDGAKASDDVKVIVKGSENESPVVNAGADKTITLPTNFLDLEGKATDPDGEIAGYQWTKVSGGHAGLSEATAARTRAYDLTEGTYVFKLTVKDRQGASASDEVRVTVNASENQSPVVSAGGDRTITLPANSLSIQGTASDPDGEIVAYQWTQVSGGNASLSEITSAKVTAHNLTEGAYVFRLTVKDNKGAQKWDDVTVTVKASPAANTPPVVNAGGDKVLTLPTSSVYIDGVATDTDGTVVTYYWTQVSGRTASLTQTTSPKLRAADLVEGMYIFRLTVKDDDGAVRSDDMTLVVRSPAHENVLPLVQLGSDKTLRLPDNAISLRGSATDEDGLIASYSWTQVSGGSAGLSETSSPSARAYNLSEGSYVFRLTVTDDRGGVASDEIRVYVMKGSSADIVPVTTNGPDKSESVPDELIYPLGNEWSENND